MNLSNSGRESPTHSLPAHPIQRGPRPSPQGVVLAILLLLSLWVVRPFWPAIFSGLAMAAAAIPLQSRMERRVKPWVAATGVSLLWTLVFLAPVVAVISVLAPRIPAVLAQPIQPEQILAGLLQIPVLGQWAASHTPVILGWLRAHSVEDLLRANLHTLTVAGLHTLTLLLHAGIALTVCGATLAKRKSISRVVRPLLARTATQVLAVQLETSLVQALGAVVAGMISLMVWDGLGAAILFAAVGLPAWAAWAAALAALSLIPIGTGLVIVLASAFLVTQDHLLAAAAVLILGHAITLTGDFYVKPRVTGARGHAPFLPVLLGILGGVEVFGLTGLILGPTLILIVFDFLNDASQAPEPVPSTQEVRSLPSAP